MIKGSRGYKKPRMVGILFCLFIYLYICIYFCTPCTRQTLQSSCQANFRFHSTHLWSLWSCPAPLRTGVSNQSINQLGIRWGTRFLAPLRQHSLGSLQAPASKVVTSGMIHQRAQAPWSVGIPYPPFFKLSSLNIASDICGPVSWVYFIARHMPMQLELACMD